MLECYTSTSYICRLCWLCVIQGWVVRTPRLNLLQFLVSVVLTVATFQSDHHDIARLQLLQTISLYDYPCHIPGAVTAH